MNFCAAFIPPLLKKNENKNYLWDLSWKFQTTSSHRSSKLQIIKFLPSSLIGDVLVIKAGIQGIEWVFVMFSFKRKPC